MLTRVYGTAFFTQAELDEHLKRLEEARARDHRKLGRELGLFMFSELSPGSPFWLPRGMAVWNALTEVWREENAARGYREVKTPILYDLDLFKTSGHWDVYRDNMYFTEVEERPMGLKPMNCPAHIQLYAAERRSYRELPVRYSEQGLVHRHEPSGTLHGLLRVRHITQDDAHIFCTPEQVQDEVIRCLEFGFAIYDLFGFEPKLELSTRPEKRIGTDEMWDRAEAALAQALDARGLAYEVNEGDGAFYGPKIDLHMTDSIGRSWQLGTVQYDESMPERFGITLHRRGRRRAPPGDDPPRAPGLLRALHRDPHRALRRRVPAVAGAGPGRGPPDRRPPRRRRAGGARRAARGGPARGDRRPRRSRSGARSARPSCARSRTCSSSATARPSRARSRSAHGTRAIRAPSPWPTSSPASPTGWRGGKVDRPSAGRSRSWRRRLDAAARRSSWRTG